ncbi:hypothetical protein AVEN_4475-1, partial [Araneus ventricosus]
SSLFASHWKVGFFFATHVTFEALQAPAGTATTEPNKGRAQPPAPDYPASALALVLIRTYTLGVTPPGTVTTLNAKPRVTPASP